MGWNNDDRLLIRAIREGWAVPADKLPGILDHVANIAAGGAKLGDAQIPASERESISATKALVAVEKLRLETIRIQMALEDREELKRRLEALESQGSGGNPGNTTGPARTDPPIGEPGDGGDGPGAA
jgi:hypothetical protein